ncbi:MAG: TatD family hydrolase [Clostridia bacterium]|nr:TatD family hydrolase [Clostridia bacterium]
MLIDSHVHLNDSDLAPLADRIVGDFATDGLLAVVNVGYDMPSSLLAVEQAGRYKNVFAAVGMHPHDSKLMKDTDYGTLCNLAEHDKVVAIGEIGLDYHYDLSPRETQKQVFERQLILADELKLPVILHVREAYEDTREILERNKQRLTSGVLLHCYSGSAEMVKMFDKYDCYYAFGGAITFKNAKHNLEALKTVRRDRLLLETDCPYMTPVPFRGQMNEPKYINLVLEKAAEILETDKEELAKTTVKNTLEFFKKMILDR